MTNEQFSFSPSWGYLGVALPASFLVFQKFFVSWGVQVGSTWWGERSKVKVLFSSVTFFFSPRYFNLVLFAKSWWNDLERIMPVVLGISWSYSMQREGPAACPKNYEIEWRLILDVFQRHSLNLTFYKLSPFSSDFPPFPPAMFLCNDLCGARDFTFSLFFYVVNMTWYRRRKTNFFHKLISNYFETTILPTTLPPDLARVSIWYSWVFFVKCGLLWWSQHWFSVLIKEHVLT